MILRHKIVLKLLLIVQTIIAVINVNNGYVLLLFRVFKIVAEQCICKC
jgi:hypothetical protein